MNDDLTEVLTERELITDSLSDFSINSDSSKVVNIIRTSDRILYKRCRRRWGWQSHLRDNLGSKAKIAPLWLGSGFHFAMEDYHGYKKYSTASKAFLAYCKATQKHSRNGLPDDFDDLIKLGCDMLDYYEEWLATRYSMKTFIFNGVPQVEVNFKIKIPWEQGLYGIDEVYYSGQLDRVAIDDDGNLWIVEYKTAKAMVTNHFMTDPQITSYCWGASNIYDRPIAGVMYQQHRKTLPKEPKLLSGGKLSTAAQTTTYRKYFKLLETIYGSTNKAPQANRDFLDKLSREETYDADPYIRRDYVFRNQYAIEAEGEKILNEVYEMLNPDLPLYPNPTRNCPMDCSFLSACVSKDDGSDWEYELDLTMEPREAVYDDWRKYLEPEEKL